MRRSLANNAGLHTSFNHIGAICKARADVGAFCPYAIACVLAYRGEVDRAYEWLGKAAQYRHAAFGSIALHPMLANLHSDPRWLPLLQYHGMAPEQLAAIEFDVKVPK
jgi:hypothetical protein